MVEAAVCTFFGKSIGSMALGKIADYLIAPIGRQFNYCFCFKGNIENLETQLEKLEITRQCVQLGVDEDNRCVRIIGPDIEDWLTRAAKVTTEAERIIEDKEKVQQGCLKGWCQNFKLRYLLSRKATKKTQVVVEVQADGIKFTKSSYLPLPPSMQPLPPIEFMEFGSRITSTEKIIEALKDDEIDLIAITGMGGVGKTTMAKEVAKRVKEENLFDEVATAVVSQDQDLLKVQSSIAKKLGLELGTDDLEVGASQLRQRLQQNKKILLILDDIWDEFNLDELGIPLSKNEKKSCKVLFTSRNQDLRLGVKSKLDFPLGILEEKEAWDLFREKVGDFADAPIVQKLAKDIVRECGGLPLALVIIGSTLQNRSLHVWKDALLRQQNPSSESLLEGVPARVYRSLQFSYNHLQEEGSKALFLLCSLFEEDYNISLEDLFRYGFGLKLFRGINDLNAARDRLYVLVDQFIHIIYC